MQKIQHFQTLKQRNLLLINQVRNLTGADKKGGWSAFQEKISAEHVKEFYRIYCQIFPLELDYERLVPSPGNSTRALFTGHLRAETILLNVNRYSLYCDEIIVVYPIDHPHLMAPRHNPLFVPSEFIQDTLHTLYFLLKLEPWVRNGIVSIVPTPFDFKPSLREECWAKAQERLKDFKPTMHDLDEVSKYIELDLVRSMYGHSRELIAQQLKTLNIMSNSRADELAEDSIRIFESDPLVLRNGIQKSGILASRNAVNLEGSLFLAAMTGSFLYTDSSAKWRELETALSSNIMKSSDWTAFTRAFQDLEFSFLNAVDPEFACGLRLDDRLESFRLYLGKTWRKLSKHPNEESSKALKEELNDEFLKAKYEWEKITLDVQKWFLPELASAAVAMGQMNINPGLGILPAAAGHLLHKHLKNRSFRKNTPLAVLIDLEKKHNSKNR